MGFFKRLKGFFKCPKLTREMVDEKGTPLSRAKDQICREAVAVTAIVLARMVRMITTVMTLAPARLCVAL